jgi:2-polyprenyl-3-methyl-5-hydroxy-6-metoxy-1,4-benzoquinol methylase
VIGRRESTDVDYRGIDPKELVRAGYNRISRAYRGDTIERDHAYFRWLDVLQRRLQPGSRVLELGCGCGIPVAQELAAAYRITGVDISEVQIERARSLVPSATFMCTDIASLEFSRGEFDAIVSFFAIIHVPLPEQRSLFERLARWLRPNGVLMASVGHGEWTGYAEDWYGAPMYWSHADEATYLQWLAELGFEVRWQEFFPEGSGGHAIVLAQLKSPS